MSQTATCESVIGSPEAEGSELSVLIVDDQNTAAEILAAIVASVDPSCRIHKFLDPREAVAWAASNPVDFALTDMRMPLMNGIEVIRCLRGLPHCADIPIVVVTLLDDKPVRYDAFEAGATDFLNKPLDQYECRARCRNLMTMRRQQRLLASRARLLQVQVERAVAELRGRELEALLMLAKAGEHRDTDTGNHVIRVSKFSGIIAKGLGLPQEQADSIETAALLHDIGKIGVPDAILLKPGPLDATETGLMRQHTHIGHSILSRGKTRYTVAGAQIALSHHERFDGAGYPEGLSGTAIPIAGRIVAVADTLDALVSRRPYKGPWTREAAIRYVSNQAGSAFDPDCISALLGGLSEVNSVLDALV